MLERGYLGGGNAARNTMATRSNHLTLPSIWFYKEGASPFSTMSEGLGFNIMFSQRG